MVTRKICPLPWACSEIPNRAFSPGIVMFRIKKNICQSNDIPRKILFLLESGAKHDGKLILNKLLHLGMQDFPYRIRDNRVHPLHHGTHTFDIAR